MTVQVNRESLMTMSYRNCSMKIRSRRQLAEKLGITSSIYLTETIR